MLKMMNGSAFVKLTPAMQERDRILGSTSAPVTLVEYGDFECPDCKRAHLFIKDIHKWLGNYMCFVFRHFPLNLHPHAQRAAEAAEAAGAQARFWEMHDRLFEHQQLLDDEHLRQYAKLLDLDVEKFSHELAEGVYTQRVREDFSSGCKSGVSRTPTFFINGLRHSGSWDLDDLLAAIEQAGANQEI